MDGIVADAPLLLLILQATPPSKQDFCQVENTALMQQCEQQQAQLSAERLHSAALDEALKKEQVRSAVLVAERDALRGEVGPVWTHSRSWEGGAEFRLSHGS